MLFDEHENLKGNWQFQFNAKYNVEVKDSIPTFQHTHDEVVTFSNSLSVILGKRAPDTFIYEIQHGELRFLLFPYEQL